MPLLGYGRTLRAACSAYVHLSPVLRRFGVRRYATFEVLTECLRRRCSTGKRKPRWTGLVLTVCRRQPGAVGRAQVLVFIGGSSEIRTHGRVTPSLVFKTSALNRSAMLPMKD